MNITERTLEVLEFNKVREMLASCAPTKGGAQAALSLMPTDDFEMVLRRQRRTTDAKRLCDTKGMPPFCGVTDISDSVGRAEKSAILSPRELLEVARVLTAARQLSDYIETDKGFDTCLDDVFARLTPNKYLENRITSSIISEDLIADEASPELAEIRRKIRNANNRIKEALNKFMSGASSKYLQENIVTTRGGRYVVPVKAEYRGEIKGLVHDTSASGATLFVEPAAVLEVNNELRVLESKESREIERILAELSSEIAGCGSQLFQNYLSITELSLVFACASLSYEMKASMPSLSEERTISLFSARHPLIDKDKVVPINVDMSGGFDTLVITGPNTGGKTVSLKTLGLLTIMAQSGLHIPAAENSVCGVFDHVRADIGDEQSIEQSLSTFSSHMVNIVEIIKTAGERSLILFDELGAGTDPVEGAALATAILEEVRRKGALTAATTHYAELKSYAIDTDGVVNASCEFNVETLRPTYRLIMGTPGKSNAFAIAGKLGIDEKIIERASKLVSGDVKKFESVIEKLDEARVESERMRDELQRERDEFARFKVESEKRINALNAEKEREIEAARTKVRQTLDGARATAEFVFDEIDKLRKQKAKDISAEELARKKREMREALLKGEDNASAINRDPDEGYVLPRALKKGDDVKMRNIGKHGVLLEDPDRSGNVRIQCGSVITRTNVSNLRLIEKENKPKEKQEKSVHRVSAMGGFSPEFDLRGQLTDDAWFMCDKYIDDAMMANIRSVRIIHGKGTGALRSYLWSWFKGDKRIASFRLGAHGEGDSGVTILELK
ncbi:MAG: endonuclease MutS2 [Clostridia bacterium]|nr:endonuclease MutS2 [Clostridia bacterium]